MIDKADLNLVITLCAELWDPEGVLLFLREPNPFFHDRSALDLLDQGDTELIIVILDRIASDAVS